MTRDLHAALRRIQQDEEVERVLRDGIPGDDDEAVELRGRLAPFARAAVFGCAGCGQADDCCCEEMYAVRMERAAVRADSVKAFVTVGCFVLAAAIVVAGFAGWL